MNFHDFAGWLLSTAGAGWVFGFVTLATFLWALWRRRRPRRVVCKELGRTSLVRIRKSAREKIAISFDGKPVSRLAQVEIDVFNQGSEVVKDASVTFRFPESTMILDISYEAVPENLKVDVEMVRGNEAEVRIPFLNPVRQHGDRVRMGFVCDGSVGQPKVVGGGEGWSVESAIRPSRMEVSRRMNKVMLAILVELPFLLGCGYLLERVWRIPRGEVSLRSLATIGPVLVVPGLTAALGLRWAGVPLTSLLYPWLWAEGASWAQEEREQGGQGD